MEGGWGDALPFFQPENGMRAALVHICSEQAFWFRLPAFFFFRHG